MTFLVPNQRDPKDPKELQIIAIKTWCANKNKIFKVFARLALAMLAVGRAYAHALTQQLNQLAFRSDAVKRQPFYIILPTHVISSHNIRGHRGPLH